MSGFEFGELLAVQGKEGCRDARCTRIGARCVGYHCPRCGEPCSSQGHDCEVEAITRDWRELHGFEGDDT